MKKEKKKREAILQAGLIIFARDGFYNAKINDISDLAGIGTGTIYLYFENKEHILKEILVDIWSTVKEELDLILGKTNITSKEKIAKSALKIYELAKRKSQIARMVLQEYAIWNDPTFENLSKVMGGIRIVLFQLIQEGIDKNEFKQEIKPELAVPFLIGAVWNFIEFALQNVDKYPQEVFENQIQILVENTFLK